MTDRLVMSCRQVFQDANFSEIKKDVLEILIRLVQSACSMILYKQGPNFDLSLLRGKNIEDDFSFQTAADLSGY